MTNWIYNGESITEVPNGMIGFVYLLRLPDRMFYVGCKTFNKNWQQYYSSSELVKKFIRLNGTEGIQRFILTFCKDRNELRSMEELMIQELDARKSLNFLNHRNPDYLQNYKNDGYEIELEKKDSCYNCECSNKNFLIDLEVLDDDFGIKHNNKYVCLNCYISGNFHNFQLSANQIFTAIENYKDEFKDEIKNCSIEIEQGYSENCPF